MHKEDRQGISHNNNNNKRILKKILHVAGKEIYFLTLYMFPMGLCIIYIMYIILCM